MAGDNDRRTQDQRGNTQRLIDANKLESDSEAAIQAAEVEAGKDNDQGVEHEPGDEDIATLRRQLAREKQMRQAAESRASESETKVGEALDATAQANLNTLKTAKTQMETQQVDLKRRLAAAHAEGDFDAIAEIQVEISNSAIRMSSIDNGIIALEAQPKQREALARRGTPNEERFRQITRTMAPVAKQWFRDNPDYYMDDVKLKKLIARVQLVMSEDDAPEENSDEYFERVERELADFDPKFRVSNRSDDSGDDGNDGGGSAGNERALSDASGGQRRRADTPPGGAPVARNGRGTGGAPQNGNRSARLTKEQQEAAAASGLTDEEYAANKRALETEGRIGPNAQNRNRMH